MICCCTCVEAQVALRGAPFFVLVLVAHELVVRGTVDADRGQEVAQGHFLRREEAAHLEMHHWSNMSKDRRTPTVPMFEMLH